MFETTPRALYDLLQQQSGTYTEMILAEREYDDDTQHSQQVHEPILLLCMYSWARPNASVNSARQMYRQLNVH